LGVGVGEIKKIMQGKIAWEQLHSQQHVNWKTTDLTLKKFAAQQIGANEIRAASY